MRVLFWTDGYWPRVGGIEVQGSHFMHQMQSFGHSFIVAAQQDYPSWPHEDNYRDIPIYRFRFNDMVQGGQHQEFKRVSDWLRKIKTEFNPDLIHLHTCSGSAAFVFWMLKRILDCPIVLTIHGLLLDEDKLDPMYDRIVKSVDHVCCVSNALINQLNEHIDVQHAVCVHNGLALPSIMPTPLPFDPPVVMMIGRLSPEKGIDTTIKAIAAVKAFIPSIKLRIVGVGPEKEKLINLVQDLQLQETVNFVGYVEPENIPDYINQSTIVVTPSRLEAFCLTALQAMQMQRPVIASNTGGLPEVTIANETALLIDPDDHQGLVDAMLKLINNPELARQYGQSGRKHAIQKFSIDRLAERYHDIYTKFAYNNGSLANETSNRKLLAN